jgi:hypothetical protein
MPTFDHGLDFRNLDDAVAYARRCLDRGYQRTGQWDLAQTCRHLTDWMRAPLDGAPLMPLPMRLVLGIVSRTIAPRMLRTILSERKMQSGLGTINTTVYPPEPDAAAAVDEFARTATRLSAHAGPWQWSPLFRTPDREQAIALHLIHSMHHLGRLKPTSAADSPACAT